MLQDRPDATMLLELLDFHPPDWRQYYEELWARYPTLTEAFLNVTYWNLPTTGPIDDWQREWIWRTEQMARERSLRDALMLAKVRALAAAVTARRGAARAQALRRLDRQLAEFGLRPAFRGGSRIPPAERPKVRQLYEELRSVIDELRRLARDVGGEANADYQRALLIRFPFFTEEELAAIFDFPYPRRGATSEAALAILASRHRLPASTIHRYLFPR